MHNSFAGVITHTFQGSGFFICMPVFWCTWHTLEVLNGSLVMVTMLGSNELYWNAQDCLFIVVITS